MVPTAIARKTKQRATFKKTVSDLIKKSLEHINDESLENRIEQITSTRDVINEKFNKITEFDEDILNSLFESETENNDEIEAEESEATEFKLIVKKHLQLIEKFLQGQNKCESALSTSSQSQNVKLPRIEIKPFDGSLEKWQTFYEDFSCAIDNRDDMSDIQKMTYLRSYLKGPAANVIDALPLTSDNYTTALQLLTDRYDNKQLLISTHMKNFLSIPKITNTNDVANLRRVYDNIIIQKRSLETLKITSEMYGPLLVPVILSKLPDELNLILNRKFEDLNDGWDITPLLETLQKEIKAREKTVFTSLSDPPKFISAQSLHVGNNSASTNSRQQKRSIKCAFCGNQHKSHLCRTVTNIEARKAKLQEQRRCFVCLRDNHISKDCKTNIQCFKCSGRHHLALCDSNFSPRPRNNESTSTPSSNLTAAVNTSIASVLLQTAKVAVTDPDGQRKVENVRILFDSCSQLSYITPALKEKLVLNSSCEKDLQIKVFGNLSSSERLPEVNFNILTKNNLSVPVTCFVKDICSPLTNQRINHLIHDYEHLRDLPLADDYNSSDVPVDILIGANFYWKFILNNVVFGQPNDPVAVETVFGYVLNGAISVPDSSSSVMVSHVLFCQSQATPSLSHNPIINQFWDLENVVKFNSNETEALQAFSDTVSFDENANRYTVGLPFKKNHHLLSDNYRLCHQRFTNLKKKLNSNQKLLSDYNSILQDQLGKNVIEKVDDFNNPTGEVHYLAHRPVIREDRTTTKLRIVFDASAKHAGPSLNDCLLPGPSLTAPLYGVLLRFRSFLHAFCGDLEKAFLQIGLSEPCRDFVRFIWFKEIDEMIDGDVDVFKLTHQVFRFTRLVFGLSPSPFLMQAILLKHAHTYYSQDPAFVEKFIQSFHVDDVISGSNSIFEGFEFFMQCKQRLNKINLNLRKFQSNSYKLEQLVNGNTQEWNKFTKILGLSWNKHDDIFIFNFKDVLPDSSILPTKRQVLTFLATLYDPLGVINPAIVLLKILFQQICAAKIPWDSKISPEHLELWNLILFDLSVTTLTIPRIYFKEISDISSYNLIGFSDASLKAYGCCIYLQAIFPDHSYSSTLITSKSRVSPMRKVTIPKLELCAAVLLSELIVQVRNEFTNVYKFSSIQCFTDSTICLYWINDSEKAFIPFIQKRVDKIRSLVAAPHWFYVDSERNPADIVSRGCLLSDLCNNSLWLRGPDFIYDSKVLPPKFNFAKRVADITFSFALPKVISTNLLDLTDISARCSSYLKLIRVTAYILRFIKILKQNVLKRNMDVESHLYITSDEFSSAEKLWVLYSQQNIPSFSNYKQLQKDLNFVVVEDVIRCQGRFDNAPLDYDTRLPIFIPYDSIFAKLLILHYHDLVLHNGVKETVSMLRSRFWIPKVRNLTKKIISSCYLCRKFEAKPLCYPAPPALPKYRFLDGYPFQCTGLDYAGPVYIFDTHSNRENKAWIFLFTCASTRAICLDVVKDCSASSCITALRRFFARFGVPKRIISDNGAQFTADVTQTFVNSKGVNWTFNVPAAPWWGGMFERLVRSTKRCLKKILNKRKIDFEELKTILAEIECILNNRPLTFLYEKPGDIPLTPNHLIYGNKINRESKPGKLQDIPLDKRNLFINEILAHYWDRWRNEYLVNLREFHKVKKGAKNSLLTVDDVVIVTDDKMPRALWRVGVVKRIIDSKDSKIRAAQVRCVTQEGHISYLIRPVNKLIMLEATNDD